MKRTEQFARKWLSENMLKDNPERAATVARELCDVDRWLSHGMVIDANEASGLGIAVELVERNDPLWQEVWYLHCCYGVLFRTTNCAKVFESSTVSLEFE